MRITIIALTMISVILTGCRKQAHDDPLSILSVGMTAHEVGYVLGTDYRVAIWPVGTRSVCKNGHPCNSMQRSRLLAVRDAYCAAYAQRVDTAAVAGLHLETVEAAQNQTAGTA